ncbi:uncharacterized protein ACIBXB_016480 isoform 3-T4 [Morphnus guianensis]
MRVEPSSATASEVDKLSSLTWKQSTVLHRTLKENHLKNQYSQPQSMGPGLCEQKLQEPSASSTYPSDVAPDDVTFTEGTAGKLRTGGYYFCS